MLHRLLLAAVEQYGLQHKVDNKLSDFIDFEETRSKTQTKNLGHLYALLAVSNRHTWRDIKHHFLQESMNRAVLWVFKKCPELRDVSKLSDSRLLELWLHANNVRMRVSMTNALFVQSIARPGGAPLSAVCTAYDAMYGK